MIGMSEALHALLPDAAHSNGDNSYDGIVWRDARLKPSQDAVLLKLAQLRKRAALLDVYEAVVKRGAAHRGKRFQIDPESRGNIANVAQMASLVRAGSLPSQAWPAAFVVKGFRTLDNGYLPVTPEQMVALAAEVLGAFVALRFKLAALKDMIDGAATAAEVEAIDVESGWPA